VDNQTFSIVAVVVLGLLAIVALWRDGIKPTAKGVIGKVEEFSAAIEAAQTMVYAAEQLYLSGQLPKDKRFEYVFVRLRVLFPDLDPGLLNSAVEAAVPLVTIAYGIRHVGENSGTDDAG